MAKRADKLREQDRRKRGRPWLRWEDGVRRETRKVGVVEEWRELAEDRGKWRSIVQNMGQQQLGTIRPRPILIIENSN